MNHARLSMESLESRLPLALASFTVELYEDAAGTPGDLIAGDAVDVGDVFFVEINAQELDFARQGLGGVALNIAWNPNVLREVDEPFDPAKIITPNLPAFRGGTLDNEKGTITNLSGCVILSANAGRAIGNAATERFALLRFQAIQAMQDSPFSMQEGWSGITQVPVSALHSDNLYFEPQTITAEAQTSIQYDVNGVDGVTPLDALLVINHINRNIEEQPLRYDVNGDNLCTANDVLLIINFMLSQADEMEHRP